MRMFYLVYRPEQTYFMAGPMEPVVSQVDA